MTDQPIIAGAAKPVRLAATARPKVASAIWWNWINSIVLATMLALIGMCLAYTIGWAIDHTGCVGGSTVMLSETLAG